MTSPRFPRIRPFNDDEKWLEQFRSRRRDEASKCCAACRKGTPTHPGGCAEPACTCHTNPPRACRSCGRVYSAPDMTFHVDQVHGGNEGSHYV